MNLASQGNGVIKYFKTEIPHGRTFKNVNNQNRTSNPKLDYMETPIQDQYEIYKASMEPKWLLYHTKRKPYRWMMFQVIKNQKTKCSSCQMCRKRKIHNECCQ